METFTHVAWLLVLFGMSSLWIAATVVALALCRAAAAADRGMVPAPAR